VARAPDGAARGAAWAFPRIPKKIWWRLPATALELPSTKAQASAIRPAVPAASGRRRVGALAGVSPWAMGHLRRGDIDGMSAIAPIATVLLREGNARKGQKQTSRRPVAAHKARHGPSRRSMVLFSVPLLGDTPPTPPSMLRAATVEPRRDVLRPRPQATLPQYQD
jgi:hypothetical protein